MTFRRKTCPHCRAKLDPGQRIHPACIDGFAVAQEAKAKRAQEKQIRAAAKVERADTKRRKEEIKSRADWLAEAKVALQGARRLEELAKGRGCMSCQRTQQEVEAGPWRPGGYWDGGHFKSKGAHPELALEPRNIWLQCKSCNAGSSKYGRKGYTVNASFEINLVASEGQALVDWLNGPHPAKHYDVDELRAIKTNYSAKTKALKSAQSQAQRGADFE